MCWSPFDFVLASDKHLIWAFFSGIIGELYGNNREVIRKIQNRILGTDMGIIGSGLHLILTSALLTVFKTQLN